MNRMRPTRGQTRRGAGEQTNAGRVSMSRCDLSRFIDSPLGGDPDGEVSGKIFQEIGDRFDRDLERSSKRGSR